MASCAVECERMVATAENPTDCGAHLAEARVFACPYRSNVEASCRCVDFKIVRRKAPVVSFQPSAVRSSRKRERPADGGIVWREEWNAFECLGCCEDYFHVGKACDRTPDRLAEIKEMLVADHTECWEFDDPRMAADARKHRKEKKRRENLRARAAGALDRQAVSWRGAPR
jgi:hypothetical protein